MVNYSLQGMMVPIVLGALLGLLLSKMDPMGVMNPMSKVRKIVPNMVLEMWNSPLRMMILFAILALALWMVLEWFGFMPWETVSFLAEADSYDDLLPANYYGCQGSGGLSPIDFDNTVPME